MTLVVNLYAGPGTGKSTNAALTFGKLKTQGISAELAHEYAKEATWEKRHNVLAFQPYVMGKQMWRIERLLGQVDVIVTDSPILMGIVYSQDNQDSWKEFLVKTHREWNTLDLFLKRNTDAHPYVEAGRSQSEDEAQLLDHRIRMMLFENAIDHRAINIQEGEKTSERIVEIIKETL